MPSYTPCVLESLSSRDVRKQLQFAYVQDILIKVLDVISSSFLIAISFLV